jgi:hypothetical protein
MQVLSQVVRHNVREWKNTAFTSRVCGKRRIAEKAVNRCVVDNYASRRLFDQRQKSL